MGSWFSQVEASSAEVDCSSDAALAAALQQCEAEIIISAGELLTGARNKDFTVTVTLNIQCEENTYTVGVSQMPDCSSDADLAATLQSEADLSLALELQQNDISPSCETCEEEEEFVLAEAMEENGEYADTDVHQSSGGRANERPPDSSDADLAATLQSEADFSLALELHQIELAEHNNIQSEPHEEERYVQVEGENEEEEEEEETLPGLETLVHLEEEEGVEYSLDDEIQWNEGLNSEQINLLPKSRYTGHGSTASCRICCCEYKIGDILRTLPCCHLFHCNCIDNWIKMNDNCPVCRKAIKEELPTISSAPPLHLIQQ